MRRTWLRPIDSTRHAHKKNRERRPRLRIDHLESRDVPAGLDLNSSTLTYSASAGVANAVSVTISSGNFVVTDTAETITTSIAGATGSGTNSVTVPTTGVTALELDLGDGANSISSSSGISITTQNLSITDAGGSLTVSGAVVTTTGNIAISADNAVTLSANVNAGSGTIAISANQDGAGSEALSETAGTITTTNTSASAATITVNTASGGTGNASIDSTSIGSASGGKLTINSNAGSILYPGTGTLTNGQIGTSNGGSAPTRVIAARDYTFTATGASSIGTTSRPMQTSSFGTDSVVNGSNYNLSAGSGGIYVTKWGTIDLTITGATATGAGNIRVVSANASGDNLWIAGNVTTGSGNIYLAADDNFVTSPGVVIGGAGFSGTVWIQANRDQGTAGQPLTMNPTSSIVTSNTTNTPTGTRSPTTQAVYLDISGDQGTPSALTLASITAGNGALIDVNAIPNGIAAEAGEISMGGSNVLDAGPNGTIWLTAGITLATVADDIGTAATPVTVAGGTVIVSSNFGNVNVAGAAATSMSATTTAAVSGQTAAAATKLSTTAGALTINAATSNINGGAITLNGAGGVVLNAQLGNAGTGAIGITGGLSGSANIVLGTGGLTVNQSTDSAYNGAISGSQGLTKTGAGNLTLATDQSFAGATALNGGTLTLGGSLTATSGVTVGASATLANAGGSVAAPVVVNGILSPGGSGESLIGTGNLSFGSGGILAVNLNGTTTPGTDYDQIDVTGTADVTNATLRILVGASSTLNVGDQFTILANDGADAITGQFANGATISAFDNPLYKFTANYAGGDSNDIVVTLVTILPPRYLDVIGGSTVSYITGSSIDSNLSVADAGGNYSITDSSGTIGLSANAIAAGWTVSGANTVTGPTAGITSFQVDLSDGNDTIGDFNGGTAEVGINSGATLTTSGALTTTGDINFTNSPVLNLGGVIDPSGNVTDSGVGTINVTGTVSPGGTINLTATDITSASTGLLTTGTIQIAATDAVGTSSNNVQTQGTTISATAGAGGVYLSEADGADFTAVAVGNISLASVAGTLNIAGATTSTGGNIVLSSADAVTVGANLTAGSGTIAIAANTDGNGSDGFTQTAGLITSGNSTAAATTITVNTSSGGTGDAVIDNTSIGSAGGGTLNIESYGGNIVYAGTNALDAFQRGIQGNGGTEPARVLKAGNYVFTTTGSGSIGTDARPMQSDNFDATNTGNFSSGSGGIYWTDWGSTAFAIQSATATGAGNVRIVTANASGHNLDVVGPVTAGSGSIYLAADDDLIVTGAIGGSGFSGTVYLAGNRDTGNTMNLQMNSGASITTSNTSASAVYLEGFNTNGTRAGGIILNNITVGDGGAITVNTNSVSTSQGTITAFNSSVVLNAGPTGQVVLTAAPQLSATSSIGTAALPINVTAGTVVATSNTTSSTTGTTSGIFVTGSSDTTFTAVIGGPNSNSGNISLATTSGILTVGGATSTDASGTITLAGAGGVVINAPLGDSNTGNITINAGSNDAVLNSTLNLGSSQALSVTAANGLQVGAAGTLSGSGTSTNAPPIDAMSGGTVSPGDTDVGTLNVGNTVLAAGSKLRIDVNNSSSADNLNITGTADITNARLEIFVNGTINVGDSFTILTNDGADATNGEFAGGATIAATNDPRYVFTLSYGAGDGNDIVAQLTSIITTDAVDVDADGLVTFASADNLNNQITVTRASGNYSITDTADTIALTADATAAGWTGDGTSTVTGPIAGVTGLDFTLNSGFDSFTGINAGSVPVVVAGTGTLTFSGAVSTSDNLTASGFTSIFGPGPVAANVLSLTASGAIGSSAQRLLTAGTTIVASAGDGGVFLSEADGADFTVTTTGAGNIDLLNNSGTLNIAGTTSTVNGNITLSSADAVTLSANLNAGAGNISISANTDGVGSQGYDQKGAFLFTTSQTPNAVAITVNTPAGGAGDAVIGQGTIGSDSGGAITVNSNGGNVLWSNDPSYTAFTASQTGLANGGSNTQTLEAYAYNFTATGTGSVGTNDRPLQIDNFGSNEMVNPDANLTASAGTGGVYVTDWGVLGNDLTTGAISAQGSGNIRVVTANSGGHNLWVAGQVTTGSGTISLYADDELTITPTGIVGGAGFSGLVDLIANRDAGNGQSIDMQLGASIITSNATANAVSLVAEPGGNNGGLGLSDLSPQGGVVLTNVTAGDGATITVNAAGGTGASRQGIIVQRDGTLVDAGLDGTVVLLARQSDTTSTTNPLATGNIGADGNTTTLTLHPIVVRAGTVIATTNGTNLGNTGNIDVIDTIAGNFTASTTGNAAAAVTLLTQSGVLTIAGATGNAGGAISLTGADGVVLDAQLGNASSGAISVTGPLSGTGNIVLGTGGFTVTQDADSSFDGAISGSQSLTKAGVGTLALTAPNTYTGGTTISAGTLFAGNSSGSATGSGPVTVDDGATLSGDGTVAGVVTVSGTLSPASGAGGGTGVLNIGSLSFGGSGAQTIAIDLNGETAGSAYDSVNVTGTVDLTGATLATSVGSGFQPLLHDTFAILSNDGGDSDTSNFAGMTEGSTFDIGNRTFKISYAGGDGNDVALEVTHITSGPPVNTVPGDQTGFEDTSLVFSSANANAISVADPDFGGPLQITLTATHGVLTLTTVNGLAFSAGDGTANASMTFVGLPADINAALDGLQYIPDANYNGAASISILSSDQGGTGDAPQTDSDSVNISLTPVNDPPSFTEGSDQSILEDAGPQTVNSWATNISAGPADESGQTLTFLVSTDNDGLFSVLPAIDASGNLTYTTAPDANGSATVTVRLMDDGGTANGGIDTSDPQTFTIDVTPVNDPPTFTKGADVTANEDAGPQTLNGWATNISPGAANESGQVLTFHVSTDNDGLFSDLPVIDANGNLTFTSAPDAFGSATVTVYLIDDGGTANGGSDTSGTQTFTITFNSVNDPPSFTAGGDQSILEDAGPQTVNSWATNISAGPANESGQTLTFLVSTDNDGLFSVLPAIDASGNLTYTTAPDANGSATITVRLMDDGGTANGGIDTSDPQTFAIDVTPVNDPPIFTEGADVTTNEDAGPQTFTGWATNISPGAANESGQVLTFHVSTNNDGLFSVLPAINSSGNLTFTSGLNQYGSATVTVYLTDDGGTANGGSDTSGTQTFTITVNQVNHAPSFTAGADQSILEDAGPQTVNGWATNISAGPPDESGQTLTFLISTNNDALFSVLPAIDASGNLTYTTAPNANGSATVTVRLMDNGGTANGGVDTSGPQTFNIGVTPVNDPPTFTEGSDQTVLEDAGPQSVSGWATGISAGPADESSQVVTFHVSTDNDALFSVLPSIDVNGDLTYTSAPNANGSATVSVYLTDNGGTANGGQDTSATQTFTINIGSVNDAPVLDPTGTPVLPFIPVWGKVLPAGGPISDLTGFISDVDTGAVKGVAITAVDNTKGQWEFYVPGDPNGWTNITGVSDSNALLLADDGNTLIRFVPKKGFIGFASITFKAWDQSDGAADGKFGNTTNVNDTAFSTASDQGWIAVGKTKFTVDPEGDTVLKSALPVYKPNARVLPLAPVMVKDILGIAGLQVTSTPKGGFGVAIISADSSDGQWQYKRTRIDTAFQPVVVGPGAILLLRPTDLLRFVPTANSSGPSPLTFVTWDPTAGVGSAGPSNLSPTGTGFGLEPGTAVLDLTPVLDLSVPAILDPVSAGQTTNEATFASMMSASRIVNSNLGVAIVGSKGSGTWYYKPAGGDWTALPKVSAAKVLFLDADTEIRFTAAAGATASTASLSFKAWDKTIVAPGAISPAGRNSVSKETEIVTVAVANQPPVLDVSTGVTLPSVSSSKKPGLGTLVSGLLGKAFSDPDGPRALKGIAVTSVDDTNGTWQYSLGLNVWVDFGTASDTSAVLLADKSKIRFVPNTGYTGPATIEYKAWDRAAGEAGDRGVDTTGLLLNMFSVQEQTATIAVTA